ncbi:sigma 54-interacting transcriptional regulator [Clostridiaceae bacterium M8S5]|nr:sigma 54-interacting transcriptional regulator [Clostridiaceae bacterium M8S5]
MKRRLGIVTSSKDVGHEYEKQLLNVFGDKIEVITYAFESNDVKNITNLDAILISTFSQYEVLKKYIDNEVEIIISKLTLSKRSFDLLRNFKIDKTAMLVNLSLEMCIETMALLYQLGFDNYELIPMYPNINEIPNLDTAITTGEMRYVPRDIKKVIDLGHRLIDKNTIVEIAASLNLEEVLSEKRALKYFESLVAYNKGVEFLISRSNTIKNQFNTLLSIMKKGVIGVDSDCNIVSCNGIAKKILGESKSSIGHNAREVLPQIEFDKFFKTKKTVKDKLIEVKGKYVTVSIYPIGVVSGSDVYDITDGAYAIIESFQSQENKQNMLRLQLANKGHIAKYNVNNIVGRSKEIEEVKSLIVRMGNSKSAVLITGESGTGKEIVAQAIHNASPIRDKHFVAINCAAISPNLLESELFGYESGAFTGALKGGKIGIFEFANNGTLFLDEIGEMPMELQARLLRVIQEKEVMRVGGNKIIKIDVRIVAATNKNLYEQVEKGQFRKDLYYRLNVLPINLPPLRDRVEDLEVLIEHIKSKEGYDFKISDSVMRFLKGYKWDGNIRELINCIEYFDNIGTEVIEMNHLPHHMEEIYKKSKQSKQVETIEDLNEKQSFVLNLFYESFLSRKKLGRRSISQRAFEENMHITEYDVRGILNKLKELGYINIEVGRGGSTITSKGIDIMKNKMG